VLERRKFTKGFPKWVLMLGRIEVSFPAVDRRQCVIRRVCPLHGGVGWAGRALRPSPPCFTNPLTSEEHEAFVRGRNSATLRESRRANARRHLAMVAEESRARCAAIWGQEDIARQ